MKLNESSQSLNDIQYLESLSNIKLNQQKSKNIYQYLKQIKYQDKKQAQKKNKANLVKNQINNKIKNQINNENSQNKLVIFPPQNAIPKYASSLQQLKLMFKNIMGKFNHLISVRQLKWYIYATCKKQLCPWKIKYRDRLAKYQRKHCSLNENFNIQSGKEVKIQEQYLYHNHSLRQIKNINIKRLKFHYRNLKKQKNQQVLQQYADMVKQQTGLDFHQLQIKKQLDKLATLKNSNYQKGFNDLLKVFKDNSYEFQYFPKIPQQQIQQFSINNQFYIPQVVVFTNQNFMKKYKQFGQFIKLIEIDDVKFFQSKFYNLQQSTVKKGRLYMKLGLILGTDNAENQIVFAFALFYRRTPQVYSSIFDCLFKLMKQNALTQTIIVPKRNQVDQGMKMLQQLYIYQFNYIYDPKTILSLLSKKYFNSELQIIFSLTYQKNQEKAKKLMNSLLNEKALLQHTAENRKTYSFEQKQKVYQILYPIQNKLFFSKISPTFVGLYLIPNQSQQFKSSNLLFEKQIRQKSFYPWDKFLPKLFDIFIKKELIYQYKFLFPRKRFKSFFPLPALKDCEKCLHLKIYSITLSNYYKSLELDFKFDQNFKSTNKLKQKLILVSTQQFKNNENNISVYLKKNQWVCSCNESQKTGIPCCHQIYAIVNSGLKILDYIHPRWIIDPKMYKNKLIKKYGFSEIDIIGQTQK